jgi:hypothetical protein
LAVSKLDPDRAIESESAEIAANAQKISTGTGPENDKDHRAASPRAAAN